MAKLVSPMITASFVASALEMPTRERACSFSAARLAPLSIIPGIYTWLASLMNLAGRRFHPVKSSVSLQQFASPDTAYKIWHCSGNVLVFILAGTLVLMLLIVSPVRWLPHDDSYSPWLLDKIKIQSLGLFAFESELPQTVFPKVRPVTHIHQDTAVPSVPDFQSVIISDSLLSD